VPQNKKKRKEKKRKEKKKEKKELRKHSPNQIETTKIDTQCVGLYVTVFAFIFYFVK
jgi:hypothetical protein